MATIEQRIYDGAKAREVLENDAFIGAFEQIEQEIVEQWKTAPLRDTAGREKLHQFLTMLNKVKTCLTATMETGKLAALDLEYKQTLLERAKGAIWQSSEPY